MLRVVVAVNYSQLHNNIPDGSIWDSVNQWLKSGIYSMWYNTVCNETGNVTYTECLHSFPALCSFEWRL